MENLMNYRLKCILLTSINLNIFDNTKIDYGRGSSCGYRYKMFF